MNNDEKSQGATRADRIVDAIKARDVIVHEVQEKEYYYKEDNKKTGRSKRSLLAWIAIIGILILIATVAYFWLFSTPSPSPPSNVYKLTLSMSVRNATATDRVIAIKHDGGDVVRDLSTLWLIPNPKEYEGSGQGYPSHMDSSMLKIPFKKGDTIYLYVNTQHEMWISNSIPVNITLIDLPSGKMKVSVVDGRYKVLVKSSVVDIPGSITYNINQYGVTNKYYTIYR